MKPGPAAVCTGTVLHQRTETTGHQFTYPVSYVWLDPDRPGELCRQHPLWSSRWPAPARFRTSDYGTEPGRSLGEAARADVGEVLGRKPTGPVRMLSQVRRWGWMFNPITIFLVWDDGEQGIDGPVGAVLEVTNTPWKERLRYPLALRREGADLRAEFDKELHVSPFLGMEYRYRLRLADRDDRVAVDIDVVDPDGNLALHTALRTDRSPADRSTLGRALWSIPLPTHRVSAGIHTQAAKLWRKGVPFVAHPEKTTHEVSR